MADWRKTVSKRSTGGVDGGFPFSASLPSIPEVKTARVGVYCTYLAAVLGRLAVGGSFCIATLEKMVRAVAVAVVGFLPLSHRTLLMFACVFQVSVAVTAYVPGSSHIISDQLVSAQKGWDNAHVVTRMAKEN